MHAPAPGGVSRLCTAGTDLEARLHHGHGSRRATASHSLSPGAWAPQWAMPGTSRLPRSLLAADRGHSIMGAHVVVDRGLSWKRGSPLLDILSVSRRPRAAAPHGKGCSGERRRHAQGGGPDPHARGGGDDASSADSAAPRSGRPPGGLHIVGSLSGSGGGPGDRQRHQPVGGGPWSPRCGTPRRLRVGIGHYWALLAVYYLVGALFARSAGGWASAMGPAPHAGGRLLYGSSMVLLGLVRQPWHFLVTFSVLLSLTQSICLVPLIAAVSGWFRRRLGLATGILLAAGGAGGGRARALWARHGPPRLQGTFWSSGWSAGSLPCTDPLFRNRPADLGLTPYGATADDPPRWCGVRRSSGGGVRSSCSICGGPGLLAPALDPGWAARAMALCLIYVVPLAVERGLNPGGALR